MVLQQFERRLERLVEGAFAKTYRKGLQPVEVGRRLTREMDLRRTMGVRGMIAPNAFTVALSDADMERFETFADALARELAEAAREHARAEGYGFLGPVEVALEGDASLRAGMFLVAAEVVEAPGGAPVASLVLPDGQRLPIGDDPVVLGRLPSCNVVIEDPNASRRHAEIRRQDDAVVLVDLGSTNGTRVNGASVSRHQLVDGDTVTIGTTTLAFEAQ
ncbi:MAG: FhaA domain-containing protein [Acidimicrobiales bacterium]